MRFEREGPRPSWGGGLLLLRHGCIDPHTPGSHDCRNVARCRPHHCQRRPTSRRRPPNGWADDRKHRSARAARDASSGPRYRTGPIGGVANATSSCTGEPGSTAQTGRRCFRCRAICPGAKLLRNSGHAAIAGSGRVGASSDDSLGGRFCNTATRVGLCRGTDGRVTTYDDRDHTRERTEYTRGLPSSRLEWRVD